MNIGEKELKSSIRSGTLNGVYVIWGDEDYLKKSIVASMKKAVVGEDDFSDMNSFSFFYMEKSDTLQLLEEAYSSPGFFSDKRFILLYIPSFDMIKKELDTLVELLEANSGDDSVVTAVVFLKDGFNALKPKDTNYSAAFDKFSKQVNIPLRETRELIDWTRKHFSKFGLFADDGVIRTMIELAGKEMWVLRGEIDKISSFVLSKGATVVSENDIRDCISKNDEADDFGLSNAITSGNTFEALSQLQMKIRFKEDPLFVLGQISRSFSLIAAAKSFIDEGRSASELATEMKIKEGLANLYFRSAKQVSNAYISEVLKMCVDTDRLLKSGVKSGGEYNPIERLICFASRSAHDKT